MSTLRAGFCGLMLAGLCSQGPLQAGTTCFTYQGSLSQGTNSADGTFDFCFSLHDAVTGGTLVAGPVTNCAVFVSSGRFIAELDFGTGPFTGENRWLEIAVRTNGGAQFTTLAPRQALTPTPLALFAHHAALAQTANTALSYTGTVASAQLSGTIPLSLLPDSVITNNASGTSLTGSFTGSGASLTNLAGSGLIWQQQRTPLLMVSSFETLTCSPTEAWVTNALQSLLTNGMRAAGWDCIAIEDGQYLPTVDSQGRLQVNPTNFPHGLKWLTDFAHARGFRLCSYITSSALGGACCAQGNPGTPDELLALHIQQTLNWGFDGLIIDECHRTSLDETHLRLVLRTFNQVAFDDPAQDGETKANPGMFLIATANCGYAGSDVVPWEAQSEANVIGVPWFSAQLNSQAILLFMARLCLKYSRFVGPGHTVDPSSFLYYSETFPRADLQQILSVYAMICGPLQVGLPVAEEAQWLADREFLAIHQDPAVIPCTVQFSNQLAEVWTRPLGGTNTGTNAVLLVNTATTNQAITVTAAMLGAGPYDPLVIRDVWRHRTISNFTGSFTWTVPPSSSVFLRVFKNPSIPALCQTATPLPMAFAPGSVLTWNSNGAVHLLVNSTAGDTWIGDTLLAAAPKVFDPSQVAGLAAWYDVQACELRCGAVINRLNDQGPGQFDLSTRFGAGRAAPVWTNQASLLNGKGWASFQAGGLCADTAQAWPQPLTWWLVMTAPTNQYGTVFDSTTAAQRQTAYADSSFPNGLYFFAGALLPAPLSSTNFQIVEVVFNGSQSFVRSNGVPVATGSIGPQPCAGISLGQNWDCTFLGNFNLAHVILYTNLLGPDQEAELLSWLNAKYKVY